ncbi:polysaccharide biosynthesis protein [Candidatus Omnitrophus magneticus]|uniref:Polysaccharide biosynthesis protein n=1 Tax=Candidatus Omnitrophus magneticus TaxID=1609969 RepID=A0A0F0CSI2_9BACT|nr:polysaccharide biosynthesis protein [Candidatus Omnitrophus magneticus]
MSKTKTIIKDSANYTASTIVGQIIGIAASIVLRRFLSPEMMGVWAFFLMILSYALFAHFGVFTAIGVLIPYFRGKKDFKEIGALSNTAFVFTCVMSIAVALIVFFSSFFFEHAEPRYMAFGIRMISLIIFATIFYNFFTELLRADKLFSIISKAILVNALSMAFFILGLTYFFGLYGIFYAALLATIATLAYVVFAARYKLKFEFDFEKLKVLLRAGFPILVTGITYTFLISVDKIVIMRLLGPKALGFYSIAILAFTYANTFPKLFGIVIFPSMQESFGETDSKEYILSFVKKPSFIMAWFLPVLLAAAFFLVPVLVYYVIPKYSAGVTSMKILLFGCFFISLAPLAQNFLISIKKQNILIPVTFISVITAVLLSYYLVKIGYGINGVSFGTSIGYAVYFVLCFYYALIHCDIKKEIYKFLGAVSLPVLYAGFVAVFCEWFLKDKTVLIQAVAGGAIFLVMYMPAVFFINSRKNIFSFLNRKKMTKVLETKEVEPIEIT